MSQTALPLVYSREVEAARDKGLPLVALESTIITHGMPYPGNLEMARRVEAIIRAKGPVPATIAVIRGPLHVGPENPELGELAQAKDGMKDSRADIPLALRVCRLG